MGPIFSEQFLELLRQLKEEREASTMEKIGRANRSGMEMPFSVGPEAPEPSPILSLDPRHSIPPALQERLQPSPTPVGSPASRFMGEQFMNPAAFGGTAEGRPDTVPVDEFLRQQRGEPDAAALAARAPPFPGAATAGEKRIPWYGPPRLPKPQNFAAPKLPARAGAAARPPLAAVTQAAANQPVAMPVGDFEDGQRRMLESLGIRMKGEAPMGTPAAVGPVATPAAASSTPPVDPHALAEEPDPDLPEPGSLQEDLDRTYGPTTVQEALGGDPHPVESSDKPEFTASSTPRMDLEGPIEPSDYMDPRDQYWQRDLARLRMVRNLHISSQRFLQDVIKGSDIRAGIAPQQGYDTWSPLDEEINRREDLLGYGERKTLEEETGIRLDPGASISRFRAIAPILESSQNARYRQQLRADARQDAIDAREDRQQHSLYMQSIAQGGADARQEDRQKAAKLTAMQKEIAGLGSSDQPVGQLIQQRIQLNQILQMLNSGTSVSETAVRYALARIYDKGALSNLDVSSFAYNRGLKGISDQIDVFLSSQNPEQFNDQIRKFVYDMVTGIDGVIDDLLMSKAKTMTNPILGGIEGLSADQVYGAMVGATGRDKFAQPAIDPAINNWQAATKPNSMAGTGIRIRRLKTGEIRYSSPATLKKYLDGGWVRD